MSGACCGQCAACRSDLANIVPCMERPDCRWSEMDFVTVLAEAHHLYAGLILLEQDSSLSSHFGRNAHHESAARYAVFAGDTHLDPSGRREMAMHAIAHLARVIELCDGELEEQGVD